MESDGDKTFEFVAVFARGVLIAIIGNVAAAVLAKVVVFEKNLGTLIEIARKQRRIVVAQIVDKFDATTSMFGVGFLAKVVGRIAVGIIVSVAAAKSKPVSNYEIAVVSVLIFLPNVD